MDEDQDDEDEEKRKRRNLSANIAASWDLRGRPVMAWSVMMVANRTVMGWSFMIAATMAGANVKRKEEMV